MSNKFLVRLNQIRLGLLKEVSSVLNKSFPDKLSATSGSKPEKVFANQCVDILQILNLVYDICTDREQYLANNGISEEGLKSSVYVIDIENPREFRDFLINLNLLRLEILSECELEFNTKPNSKIISINSLEPVNLNHDFTLILSDIVAGFNLCLTLFIQRTECKLLEK